MTITRDRRVWDLHRACALLTGLVACLSACSGAGISSSGTGSNSGASRSSVTLTDQWPRTVQVPLDPRRVVVIEWEGLVTKSMRAFGVDDRLVGVDKPTTQMGVREAIVPGIKNAENLGTAFSGVNLERLTALRPDVVFLEAWADNPENRLLHQRLIDRLETLRIPTVVLLSPSNHPKPNLRTAWQIIELTAAVFGKQEQAKAMVTRVHDRVAEVTRRVPATGRRPKAVLFATRKYVMGTDSIQSFMLTDLLRAENPANAGTFVPVSEEKLLALDPDVLLVIGHEGYLPVEVIRHGGKAGLDWGALASMRAIRGGRLTSLGYDEWRATLETPVALMKLAKALYPTRFADIDIEAYQLSYYRDVFGLTEPQAKAAINHQEFAGALAHT